MSGIVLVVLAVLLISAMCSLFEAVLYSVPLGQVESLAANKHLSGRILKRLRRQVDRPIAAILSLNTIANTAGAAIAGALVVRTFGSEWLGVFSGALTLAILLFSEIVPKTAGVLFSRPLAALIAVPLQLLVWAMAPLVWLCRGMTWVVTRGRKTETHISDEELIVLAKVGLGAGTIDPDEAAVIHNILTIERTEARRIMTPRSVMVTLPAAMTVEKARLNPHFYTHSRIPVYDKLPDDVVGWVHRPAVLRAVLENRGETRLEELMRPPWFVPASVPVKHLLRLFLQRREQLAIVIDSLGTVLGLVTLEDVLEEILGEEIVDESDKVPDMRELARERRSRLLGEDGLSDDDA